MFVSSCHKLGWPVAKDYQLVAQRFLTLKSGVGQQYSLILWAMADRGLPTPASLGTYLEDFVALGR